MAPLLKETERRDSRDVRFASLLPQIGRIWPSFGMLSSDRLPRRICGVQTRIVLAQEAFGKRR